MELDKSKQMLQQRCRELLGSDLAELRIQKTERKAALCWDYDLHTMEGDAQSLRVL